MNLREKLSKEEIKTLKNDRNWTLTKIAKKYGVSRQSLYNYIKEIEQENPSYFDSENIEILTEGCLYHYLYEQKWTIPRLAKHLKISDAIISNTLAQWRKINPDKFVVRTVTKEGREISPEKMSEYLRKGKNVYQIGMILGLSTSYIYQLIQKFRSKYPDLYWKIPFARKNDKNQESTPKKESIGDILDKRTCLELHQEMKTLDEIAVMYNVSVNTIKQVFTTYDLPIPSRKKRDSEEESSLTLKDLQREIELGSSDVEIVKKYNTTFNYLQYVKRKYGIKKRIKEERKERTFTFALDDFEEWYIVEGKTEEEIARIVGEEIETIQQFREQHQIPKYQ